ncbi:hypothetical protein [Microbacterium sp. Mcb102]|uniref:hypothetical protein n=1 Tax=Microbacterium sp. Mcb102 TaxID=2926012 RepID=UPI0021C7F1A2|nr:hypothetical protein [Microbacterium sp. Mcb102]
MSNKDAFTAGAVGGALGSIGGAALAQPGGVRRVLGIIGLVLTVITTGLLAGLVPNLNARTPGAAVGGAVLFITLVGVLWLPWASAKTSFPWTKFRWHWAITSELLSEHFAYATSLIVGMGSSAVIAIVTAWMGLRGPFALAFVAYALCGLLWGFLTASIVRRTVQAQAQG